MAPSLSAIAFYRTEKAAQAALEALERAGFVIKEIVTAPAQLHGHASAEAWSSAQPPVSIGLFVSDTASADASLSVDSGVLRTSQGAAPGDPAPSGPHGYAVIVYSQAKEKAIQTLASMSPMQMYRYY